MQSKVVIITGANNGIGLGLARALHALGYRVAGLDLSVENLSDMTGIVCDVTAPEQVEAAVAQVVAQWGRVDILVNNACRAVFAPFEERTVADMRHEFEVNYFGYVHAIKAVLPHMKEGGGGIIHNVSSTVGLSGFAGLCGYASAKGAVEALTRTLALELAPHGIAVNVIHPPLTRTQSAAPLDMPAPFLADADAVGRKLARRIGARSSVVTPGLAERIGAFMARLMPGPMGRLMSAGAARARGSRE